jgi:hypothetical protein
MNRWIKKLSAFMIIAVLAIASSALAESGWISVPSTPDSTDKVVIKGGNLPAWSTVKVVVTQSNGTVTDQLENVAADGTLKVEYLPATPGGYTVKVYDKAGIELGGGSFGYFK